MDFEASHGMPDALRSVQAFREMGPSQRAALAACDGALEILSAVAFEADAAEGCSVLLGLVDFAVEGGFDPESLSAQIRLRLAALESVAADGWDEPRLQELCKAATAAANISAACGALADISSQINALRTKVELRIAGTQPRRNP